MGISFPFKNEKVWSTTYSNLQLQLARYANRVTVGAEILMPESINIR